MNNLGGQNWSMLGRKLSCWREGTYTSETQCVSLIRVSAPGGGAFVLAAQYPAIFVSLCKLFLGYLQ